MAVYRVLYEKFWTDADVSELDSDERFFFMTALLNRQANMCGCYEITTKQFAEYMAITPKAVEEIIKKFERRKKHIYYDWTTKEIYIINWQKHNWTASPSIDRRLREEIMEIKNDSFRKMLIDKYNSRDSVRTGKSEMLENNSVSQLQIDSEIPVIPCEENDVSEEAEEIVTDPPEREKTTKVPVRKICNLWNEICVSYGKVMSCEGKRKSMISARWKVHPDIEVFKDVFQKAEDSDFLKGNNNRGWSADFDWVLKPSNFQKVLEGKYMNRTGQGTAPDDGWAFINDFATGGGVQ